MSNFRIFPFFLLTLLAPVQAQLGTVEEVQGTTDTPAAQTTKATIAVSPAYLEFPDDAGFNPLFTGKDLNLAARWDFEEVPPFVAGPFKNQVAGGDLTAAAVGAGAVSAVTVKDGVSRALDFGAGYVSGTTVAALPASADGKFTVSMWFKAEPGEMDDKFVSLVRINNYFGVSASPWPAVVALYKNTLPAVDVTYLTIRGASIGANTAEYQNLFSGTIPMPALADPSLGSQSASTFFKYNFQVPNLDDGKWHHLVVTFNRAGAATGNLGHPFGVFIDEMGANDRRTTIGSVAYAAGTNGFANPSGGLEGKVLLFGAGWPIGTNIPHYRFGGRIDRVRVYGRVLNDDERGYIHDQNADGASEPPTGKKTDIVELNEGTNPLDHTDPGPTTLKKDDQGLSAVTGDAWDVRLKSALARWDFEQFTGAGNFEDLARDNDLTLSNVSIGEGMPSKGARFNGTAQMKRDTLDWGGVNKYTLSYWVRFDSGGKFATTESNVALWDLTGVDGNQLTKLFFSVTRQRSGRELLSLSALTATGSGAGLTWDPKLTNVLSNGNWHHIALARGAGAYVLWIDGVAHGQADYATPPGYNWVKTFDNEAMSFTFGGLRGGIPVGYSGFEGNVDRLRVFNDILSDAEVGALYRQDYDGDGVSDLTEKSRGRDPLVTDPAAQADGTWDENNLPAFPTTAAPQRVLAHWNFESFKYRGSGSYFENQAHKALTNPGQGQVSGELYSLVPDEGVSLGTENVLAGNYAQFREAGSMKAELSNILASKDYWGLGGWLKIEQDSIWEANGIPAPLWNLEDVTTGGANFRLYAVRLGEFTQIFYVQYDGVNGNNVPVTATTANGVKWILPRTARLDDEGWHHLMFRKTPTAISLFLDGKALTGQSLGGAGGLVNFSGSDALLTLGKTFFKIGANPAIDYHLKGGWDRLRLYGNTGSAAIPTNAEILELYNQDTDGDLDPDIREYGVPGRSSTLPDAGNDPLPDYSADLALVDLQGVPPALNKGGGFLGLWDFENLNNRVDGFANKSPGTLGAMVPMGTPVQSGQDPGTGMPSLSAYVRDGGYLSAKANQFAGRKEFSTSMWIRTEPGLLDREDRDEGHLKGVCLIALEDLQRPADSNTLALRLEKKGQSQSLIVQSLATLNGFVTPTQLGAAWSLVDRRLDDGSWHHVAWVRTEAGSRLFVDGALLTERNVTPGNEERILNLDVTQAPGASPRIVLGRASARALGYEFAGNFDRVRAYGKALSNSEVASLYKQDFDGDGFSDFYELGRFGFDPLAKPVDNSQDPGESAEDWDDDTGLTDATNLQGQLVGSWGFERSAGSEIGDSGSSIRFPAQYPASAGSAVAEGGVQWNLNDGMLSRSVIVGRNGFLSFPGEIFDSGAAQMTTSFWVRMGVDEIASQAMEIEGTTAAATKDKIALVTFGTNQKKLPHFVASVDGAYRLFVETYSYQGNTATRQERARWHLPVKLDDGRWHHVVLSLGASNSLFVDANTAAVAPDGTPSPFPAVPSFGGTTDPYLWIGFRENKLLDVENAVVSNLPYRGFEGAVDRVRFYTKAFNATLAGNLYFQDRDEDTIPDVTEANSFLDPYKPEVPLNEAADHDRDGLSKTQESILGTEWRKPDSDGDWAWDGWENAYMTGANTFQNNQNNRGERAQDRDADDLNGWQEFLFNTDPDKDDTDGDNFKDGVEFRAGSDPTNASSLPAAVVDHLPAAFTRLLPGGTLSASAPPGGAPSYSYSGSDATGPRYRKVALNGRPLADESPEAEGETDGHKEETYVDAYSLGLHHDHSLVYVPLGSSELALHASLSLSEKSWSNRSGLRPQEELTNPFGPCWSSNLCAYVEEVKKAGDLGNDVPVTYSAIDEDGRLLKFGSYDGVSIFSDPSSLSDRKSYQHELRRQSNTTLVMKKKFGTKLTYELTDLIQDHFTNRAGPSPSKLTHRYYRLVLVEDRFGNQLRYGYPAHKATLIPTIIYDPKRTGQRITIQVESPQGKPQRIKSITDPRGYTHQFGYLPVTVPLGGATETPSIDVLASIIDPMFKVASYSYEAVHEAEVSDSGDVTRYFAMNVRTLTDKRSVTTEIAYEKDDDKYYASVGSGSAAVKRIYGLPRLVKRVTSAAASPAGFPGASDVSGTAEFSRKQGMCWIYDSQGVRMTSGGTIGTPSTSWYNDIRDSEGKTTSYVFRDVEAGLVDTGLHGSDISLNWMIYYLQMDIIHPDGIGTETYKFDLSSGLSVKEATDICNNRTLFRYNDAWGGISIAPSNLRKLALFARWGDPTEKIDALNRKEHYTFSPNFRVMSSSTDVHGTLTAYEVDRLGRRTAMTVTDSVGAILAKQRYEYNDLRFPNFMTKKVVVAFASATGLPWEADLVTLSFADNLGRLMQEVVDMNRNGLVDATPDPVSGIRPDLVTQYEYDKNNNRTAVIDPRFNETDFVYDPMNRLCRTVHPPADGPDRNVRAEELTLYDANGNQIALIDGNGNFTINKYDALDRLKLEIRDMDGGHNPNKIPQANLEGEIYYIPGTEGSYALSDLVTEYFYNKIDSKVSQKDPRGIVTKTVYDGIQRPVEVWENYVSGDTEGTFASSGGKRLTYYAYERHLNCGSSAFSGDSFKPTMTIKKHAVMMASGQAEDVVSTAAYDDVYRPLSESIAYTPSNLTISQIEYDDPNRRETKTVAFGETYESSSMTQYDGLRRVVSVVTDVGGSDPNTANTATTTLYSSIGLAFRVTDPAGRMTETDYDAAGRTVKTWQPRIDLPPGHGDFGKVDRVAGLASELAGSPVMETSYDEAGNVKSTKSPRGFVTTYTCDARNRKVLTTLPAIDADGKRSTPAVVIPTSEVFYDAGGRTIAASDYRGNLTRTFYDNADRVWFTRVNPVAGEDPSPAGSPSGSGPNDIVTENVYDKAGNVISARDGNGSYTRNSYDALNRLVATTTDPVDGDPVDPSAGNFNPSVYQGSIANSDLVVTNVVDDSGNIVEVTDGKNQKTAFRFDGKGRRTRVIWDPGKPLVRTEEYTYDGMVLTQRKNADLTVVAYGYDRLMRLTSATYPDRPEDDRIQGYDRVGNLTAVSYNGTGGNPGVRNVAQSFDASNRLLSEMSNGKSHSHTYDKSGNRKTTTYGGTLRHIISTYDALERLSRIEEKDTSAAGPSRDTWYGYDRSNNIILKELPNGIFTLVTFDDLNRRLEIVDKIPGSDGNPDEIISSFNYISDGYDQASNVLRVLENYSVAGVKPREVVNTYDRANRLLTETSTATGEIIVTTYTYDKGNNRARRVINGPVPEDLTYVYGNGTTGNSNQLMSFGPTATGVATKSYSYDANGNRTGVAYSSRADIYQYDRDHRLVQLSFQTTPVVGIRGVYRYLYDHRTRRVQKSWDIDGVGPASSVVTDLSFSGGTSVQEWTGLTITRQYVRGSDYGGGIGGILYSMGSSAADRKFSHYNSRGDVIGQTDGVADATWQASYEAFGTRVDEAGTAPEQPQRANTKDEDPTNLLNEGMRYRDLETGSFITRDPAGFVDGPNVYTYVNQNPWTKVDPDGLFWSLIVTAATFAVDTYQVCTNQISGADYAGRVALNAVAAVADIATGGMGGGMAVRIAATASRAGKVGVAALKTAVVVDKAEMAVTTAQAAISAKDAIEDGDYKRAALSAVQVGLSVHGAKKDIEALAPRMRPRAWGPTHSQNEKLTSGSQQSHHIMQDAAMRDQPRYSRDAAPTTKLEGGSHVPGSPHDWANRMQLAAPRGLRGNYGNERYVAYLSMRAAGQSRGTARYNLERADRYFKERLGMTNRTPTRVPGRGPRRGEE